MIEEEYNKALRTDSFEDIWERAHKQPKVHHHNRRALSNSGATTTSCSSPREEPGNEGITKASRPLSLRLLLEYFDTTLEVCNGCTSLLAGIDRTRTNQRSLHRLLLGDTRNHTFFSELASYMQLDNPLSNSDLAHIQCTHSLYSPLLFRLKAAHRRLALQAQLLRCVFTVTCGVLAFTMTMVKSAAAQVDAAAKGIYIVGRDLDTISQMVRRLNVDVEHDREVVAWVLRSGKTELVRELAREVESGEVREQLDELEEHVYLCLLNINRSRRIVVGEMGGERD